MYELVGAEFFHAEGLDEIGEFVFVQGEEMLGGAHWSGRCLLVLTLQDAEALGEVEVHVLIGGVAVVDFGIEFCLKIVDDFLDQVFGSRCAGGEKDGLVLIEPVILQFGDIVDEFAGRAGVFGDFDEATTVGAVLGAYDYDEVGFGGEESDDALSIGGGVADVLGGGIFDVWVFFADCRDDAVGIVHAECCLGKESEWVVFGEGEFFDVFR